MTTTLLLRHNPYPDVDKSKDNLVWSTNWVVMPPLTECTPKNAETLEDASVISDDTSLSVQGIAPQPWTLPTTDCFTKEWHQTTVLDDASETSDKKASVESIKQRCIPHRTFSMINPSYPNGCVS
jgi:hypothetical protein